MPKKASRIFEFHSSEDTQYYVRLVGDRLTFQRDNLTDTHYSLSIALDQFDELIEFVYTESRKVKDNKKKEERDAHSTD